VTNRAVLLITLGFAANAAIAGGQTARPGEAAFREGMRARDGNQWAAVAAHMRDAIRVDPKEDQRRIGGFGPIGGSEYMPYFRLGEALYRLGDCSGALIAWEESEAQRVIAKQRGELKMLQEGSAACEAKGFLPGAAFRTAAARAEAALEEARKAGHALADYGTAHPEAWRQDLRERHDRAREDLAGGQEKLAEAGRTRRAADLTESVSMASRASAAFHATRGDMEEEFSRVSRAQGRAAQVERLIQGVEALDRNIDATVAGAAVKFSLPNALSAERQKARDLVLAARQQLRSSPVPSTADLNDAERMTRQAESLLTPVVAQVAALGNSITEREVAIALRSTEDAYAFTESQVKSIRQLVGDKPPAAEIAGQVVTALTSAEHSLTRGRRAFDAARKAGNLAAIRAAGRVAITVRADLDKLAPLLGPVENLPGFGVPPPIMDGARRYFEGRYEEALQVLTDELANGTPMPLQAHVHVLQAAALYALYVRSGETDAALRARARAAADACLSRDPAFQPNPAAFAPRFISFFLGKAASAQ